MCIISKVIKALPFLLDILLAHHCPLDTSNIILSWWLMDELVSIIWFPYLGIMIRFFPVNLEYHILQGTICNFWLLAFAGWLGIVVVLGGCGLFAGESLNCTNVIMALDYFTIMECCC